MRKYNSPDEILEQITYVIMFKHGDKLKEIEEILIENRKPLKLHFDADWLRGKIDDDEEEYVFACNPEAFDDSYIRNRCMPNTPVSDELYQKLTEDEDDAMQSALRASTKLVAKGVKWETADDLRETIRMAELKLAILAGPMPQYIED